MKKELIMILTAAALVTTAGAQNNLTLSTDDTTPDDDCDVILRSDSAVEITEDGLIAEVQDNPNGCLRVGNSGGGAVALDASPFNDVDENTSVTVSWSVPAEHTCTLQRNGATLLNDSQIDANTSGTTSDTVTADTTYRMDCLNTKSDTQFAPGAESAYATALVTVLGGGGGPPGGSGEFCGTQIPGVTRIHPVPYSRNRQPNDTASTYEEIWGPWGTSSATIFIDIMNGQYGSIPFTTPALNETDNFGLMSWETILESPDQVAISVSTCIGGPLQATALPQTGSRSCYRQGSGGSGIFAMSIVDSSSGCVLEPNTTYYLNFALVDANGNAGCNDLGGCLWFLTEK